MFLILWLHFPLFWSYLSSQNCFFLVVGGQGRKITLSISVWAKERNLVSKFLFHSFLFHPNLKKPEKTGPYFLLVFFFLFKLKFWVLLWYTHIHSMECGLIYTYSLPSFECSPVFLYLNSPHSSLKSCY